MPHEEIDARKYKKTKIIATVGPASQEKIGLLLESGVNGIRLNFSHNTHKWHCDISELVRKEAKKLEIKDAEPISNEIALIENKPEKKLKSNGKKNKNHEENNTKKFN